MFVFKAAVVGSGDAARELAAAIEAAGVEAVLVDGVSFEGLGDVDLVIEAMPERMEVKHRVFAELDAATPGHAILATTTSGLSITEIGEITLRPDKVVGLHFAGPRVVEVVESDDTSPETAQVAAGFVAKLRRSAVRCAECPGFVVNRVLASVAAEQGSSTELSGALRDAYGDRFQPARDISEETSESRAELKAFVEACLILEEGIAGVRDIDLGTGRVFAKADARGLDEVLAALEQAQARWGEHFEPPLILRRLVAQGRLGVAAGQGFHPYPQVDAEYGPVKLDVRGDIAVVWIDNPPANSLGPATVEGLAAAWDAVVERGIRAMVLASASPALFCAGADIKAFTQWDEASGRSHLERIHALGRAWEASRVTTIAAVNGLAYGGGCEIAMACDVRLAGRSATFGQPEINLGLIPGFGGSQRLGRLVGPAKALEMNTVGEPISAEEAFEYGLANRVLEDHELFDAALAWARKLSGQAPLAVQEIKRLSHHADLDAGLAAERDAFLRVHGSEDGREGVAAFIEKRAPSFSGR
jgi:enoyl-CoA hydratase / 3-hydroxyacyl-CoA dehydrogenase